MVEDALSHPDFAHLQLGDFKVDKSLSTTDNVVLRNSVTGETHISFRGTTDDVKRTGQLLKDWTVNTKSAFNPSAAENSSRFMEASAQTERVIAKYGKRFLTVSGHSQGGGISSLVAQAEDLAGFHYNPAISLKQVAENAFGKFSQNIEKQIIYKTHMDFASPLAYFSPIQKGFKVNLIGTRPNVGIDKSLISTHSIDYFAAEGGLAAERNTMVASMKNSLGTVANVAAQGYFFSQDVKKDLKDTTTAYKVADIGVDVVKNAGEFVVDNMIMDTTSLLGGPVGFAVGLGATMVSNMGVDLAAAETKQFIHSKPVAYVANGICSRDANKVAHWFKHHR
jgi:hypothetical protein